MANTYTLVQDEPWSFLDARKNPVTGRKLTFRLEDGTYVELDVTPQQYRDAKAVKALLDAEIAAHTALKAL